MASPSALSLDLSALQRRPVFTSDARVDSHDLVAREFSDHGLKWCSGAVDTALSKVRIRQLQMFMLQYGAEVEIRPRPFDDFVLVHLSLSGLAEMVSDGVPIRLPAGAAALIAPRTPRGSYSAGPQTVRSIDCVARGDRCPSPGEQ